MAAGELRVVTKTYDLTLWLLTQINKLPRSYRFVLGDRMENATLTSSSSISKRMSISPER